MLETAVWGIVLAVVVLVAVPIDVFLALEREDRVRTRVELRWLRFRWTVPIGNGPRHPRVPRKKTRRSDVWRAVRAIAPIRGEIPAIGRLLRRLMRSLRLRRVQGDVRFGTGDPADTGRLWGLLAPTILWVRHQWAIELRAEPDFVEPGWTGTLEATFRIYPARVIGAVVFFVFSPAFVRIGVAALRNRPREARA